MVNIYCHFEFFFLVCLSQIVGLSWELISIWNVRSSRFLIILVFIGRSWIMSARPSNENQENQKPRWSHEMMESFHSSILGPVNREWPKGPKVVFGKDWSMGSMAYSDPFTEETMERKISYYCIFKFNYIIFFKRNKVVE